MGSPDSQPSADARSTREQTEVLRRLRHDLRTPLHVIAGFAELLATHERDPVALGYVERIQAAAKRLETLLEQTTASSVDPASPGDDDGAAPRDGA